MHCDCDETKAESEEEHVILATKLKVRDCVRKQNKDCTHIYNLSIGLTVGGRNDGLLGYWQEQREENSLAQRTR